MIDADQQLEVAVALGRLDYVIGVIPLELDTRDRLEELRVGILSERDIVRELGKRGTEVMDNDVVAKLRQAGHFETLLEALEAADLAEVLHGDGSYERLEPGDREPLARRGAHPEAAAPEPCRLRAPSRR